MTNKAWRYIVIHHSFTEDGKLLNNFKAIENYHTSYRYNDNIISKQKADKLMAQGKYIIKPWRKIGYHYVIEYDNNILVTKPGRLLDESGAHCQGLNGQAIGVCVIGNFDVKEPDDAQYEMLVNKTIELMKQFNIPIGNIRPHSYFAPWKSCPGHKFNWTKFICAIQSKIGGC
jgi:N-acetyl-anhydromuramyl-L-alanine amidase AmpD